MLDDQAGNRPKVYGVCGMAVGELIPAQMVGWYLTSYNPYDPRPIASIWASATTTTLTVYQRSAPSNLLVLGIGPLLLPPVVGASDTLVVDPAQALLWWTAVPANAQPWQFPLQLQIPLPPGLPFGLQVGLQAAELTPQGEIRLSNATVFGVR